MIEYRDTGYIEYLEVRAEFLQDESNDIVNDVNEANPDGQDYCPHQLTEMLVASVLAQRAEMFRSLAEEEKKKPRRHLAVVQA
jgi:hypothetical protein